MRQPNLLFAVRITVEAINVASTVYDNDERIVVRSPQRTTYRFMAQVRFRSLSEPSYMAAGIEEDVEGWLTVRPVDLARINYVPKNGDRIVAIGSDTSGEYYIRHQQNMGHYTSLNGHGLQRLYFEDRRPAAAKPNYTRES